MPLFGPPDVEKLRLKRDVPGLIDALGYNKDTREAADVRFYAAEALGLMGDRSAVEPLLGVLWDKSPDVRWVAAEALGRLRDTRVVVPLGDLLTAHLPYEDEPFPRLCKAAVKALGRLGDRRAVEPLLGVFDSLNEDLRREAADALDEVGWTPDSGSAGASYWAVRHDWLKCIDIGEPAVGPLSAVLSAADATTRLRAVETLGEIGGPHAARVLVQCLKDWRLTRRDAVVQALGRTGDSSAARALVECLSQDDVRPAAIKALSAMGEPAVQPLMRVLDSPDVELVAAAAEALAGMGPTAFGLLRGYLDGPGRSAPLAVRTLVADALTRILDGAQ
jgi:HEAT repeat protein